MRPFESLRLRFMRVSVWQFSATISLASLALSFACFALAEDGRTFAEFALAAAGLVLLLLYPEFALALYVVIGDVKGDDRVAALVPVDLTLALGAILVAGLVLNLIRGKQPVALPAVFLLFVPLLALAAISLAYTPAFPYGLEKLGRLVTVTAVAVVAPFFVLPTPAAMKRFFFCFGGTAYAICLYSLAGLGGADRLVSPSDNTIGLGRVACILTAIIWVAAMPRFGVKGRILVYGVLSVPLTAMIGSGSRGAAVTLALVILASLFWYRRLIIDAVAFASLAFGTLPFIRIPDSSFNYLATLGGFRNMDGILDFRADLLNYGWTLLQQHPLLGAGIGGFRYSSPNPGLYKWPHNIFLELACELGIPAALLACWIFGSALREAWRNLKDSASPYFTLSAISAALLLIGIVNAVNTGDINSDRSSWLFVSLVFVIQGYRLIPAHRSVSAETSGGQTLAEVSV